MNKSKTAAALVIVLLLLQGCSTYAWTSVDAAPGAPDEATLVKKTPDQIFLTEGDILDKPYRTLGDISVNVHKTSIFNSDPTRNDVNEALKKRAADMGADAVVLVKYGSVGIGLMSWGELEGNGRAVLFQ